MNKKLKIIKKKSEKNIQLGLCCLNITLKQQKPAVFASRTVRIKTVNERGFNILRDKIIYNLQDTLKIIEWNQQNGDPTEHFHKLTLTKGEHNFALVTDPLELSPDALTTTLNLSVDQSASVDSVATPFIVLEYLIKI